MGGEDGAEWGVGLDGGMWWTIWLAVNSDHGRQVNRRAAGVPRPEGGMRGERTTGKSAKRLNSYCALEGHQYEGFSDIYVVRGKEREIPIERKRTLRK